MKTFLIMILIVLFASPVLALSGGSGHPDGGFGKPNYRGYEDDTPTSSPVPEPTTMLLVGGGLAGMAIIRKKFRK
jgi:hypothetical protein